MVVNVPPLSEVTIGVEFGGGFARDEVLGSMEYASRSSASGEDILYAAGKFSQI
jgi:hypothetical protein